MFQYIGSGQTKLKYARIQELQSSHTRVTLVNSQQRQAVTEQGNFGLTGLV